MQSEEKRIEEQILLLEIKTKEIVNEGIKNQIIDPTIRSYYTWKVDRKLFEKSNGQHIQKTPQIISKTDWNTTAIDIFRDIQETETYQTTLNEIKNKYPKQTNIENMTSGFVRKTIKDTLNNAEKTNNKSILLKDLNNEPVRWTVSAEFQGIAIEDEKIVLNDGSTLRKPRIEDLEKVTGLWDIPHQQNMLSDPSAILEFETYATNPYTVQEKVEKCTATFKLFKVGNAQWTSYRMIPDSFKAIGGTLSIKNFQMAPNKYTILKSERGFFEDFYKEYFDKVPTAFSRPKDSRDYLPIAFERYAEALIDNPFERRIMYAMMSFEAIFSESDQEISFKLRTRISKMFGLLGYKPLEITKEIRKAYGIRSTFAHGGILSSKDRQKINTDEILNNILDYVRISILIMISSGYEKSKFIQLIDDAIVDPSSDGELKKVLENSLKTQIKNAR